LTRSITSISAPTAFKSLDVLACPRCGGRLRMAATVEDPVAVREVLADPPTIGAPTMGY
jgi:hypothetical protein